MQHPNKIKFYEAREAMQVCNTNSNVGPNIVNQMIPFYNMDKSCMLLFTATVKPSSIKYIQFTHTHTSLPLSLYSTLIFSTFFDCMVQLSNSFPDTLHTLSHSNLLSLCFSSPANESLR